MEKRQNGTLFIVPTPVGNLEDITLRAVRTLSEVALIGAEDTRKSGRLLKHYKIETPMISCHKFNERSRIGKLMGVLDRGDDVALITDAGTPGISDPSNLVIRVAIDKGFRVEALPGPTAFVPALVASGIDQTRFYFAGFLPAKRKDRDSLLEELSRIKATLIFYEAPHRLTQFFSILFNKLGNRRVVIARELTKLHEEYLRSDLEKLNSDSIPVNLKGEFVIIVSGFKPAELPEEQLFDLIEKGRKKGVSTSELTERICRQTGAARNRIYKLILEQDKK